MLNRGLATPGILISALLSTSGAQAQVTVDMSKITCEQYVLYKIQNSDFIPFWIQGYFSAKRGNTIIDAQQFKSNAEKVKAYCRMNSNVTVMQAVEKVLGIVQ